MPDNIAQYLDLLNIGVAFDYEDGEPRDFVSIEWNAFPSEDWGVTFLDGKDYKHADANGNGMVGSEDIAAILRKLQRYPRTGSSFCRGRRR